MDVSVKDNGNGTYSCSYVPKKPLKHTAMVSWGGVNIPQSPFRVRGGPQNLGGGSWPPGEAAGLTPNPPPDPQVGVGAGSHPHKVKVYGPGVAKTGLKAHEPTYFTVDCTEAGQGEPGGLWGGKLGV